MATKRKLHIPPLSDAEAQKYIKIINEKSTAFVGQLDELESAIGMMMLGRLYGWRVLVLIHSKRTLRKYEGFLGIDIREMFPETGPLTPKSVGYEAAQKFSNFWKAVSGDLKVERRKEAL